MKVLKYGGTSVGKPERMKQIADWLLQDNQTKIVVLSALSGTTNSLVSFAENLKNKNIEQALGIIKDLEKHYHEFCSTLLITNLFKEEVRKHIVKHFDFLSCCTNQVFNDFLAKEILAQGELMSCTLFSYLLKERNTPHVLLNALDFIKINENEEPEFDFIENKLNQILKSYENNKLFITQGYICLNHLNKIDNLKRGGSDYTASLISAAVNASVCEIWTDIDGMHNNDPRIVKKTYPVHYLHFEEAAELAYFGAKILHPTCILPAKKAGVEVKLLNTMEPQAEGTTIGNQIKSLGLKAVAAKDEIKVLRIISSRMFMAYGFLEKVFKLFANYKLVIDMVTTSEVAVAVSIDSKMDLKELISELETFSTVELIENLTIIAFVGYQINKDLKFFNKLFQALTDIELIMIDYGGSQHNLSVLVHTTDKCKTLTAVNQQVFDIKLN